MDITDIGPGNLDQVKNTRLEQLQRRAENLQRRSALQKDDDKLKEACRQFEAIFVKQMLNSMRDTVSKNGLIDGGFSEEIFEDMLYDRYAEKMTKTAGFGIADMLYKQFSGT